MTEFAERPPVKPMPRSGGGRGLTISRELADVMDGSFSVASVEGRGSTFTVEPPLAWTGPPAQAETPAITEFAPFRPSCLPPVRILAAEDNRTNQIHARRSSNRSARS